MGRIRLKPFGLYYGIWHSISAFCNAGFDLCGSTSLVAYNTNPIINFIVPFEIIMGGLGFIVVLDILRRPSWAVFC